MEKKKKSSLQKSCEKAKAYFKKLARAEKKVAKAKKELEKIKQENR